MQIHNLQPTHKKRDSKRVGRGGKRGSTSGHGTKGQKGRAGARIRPGFRGGDNPIWKLFPKQRGASKKTDVTHAMFRVHPDKALVLNVGVLEKFFENGNRVDPKALVKKGLVKTARAGVKLLGDGELTKKLTVSGIAMSKSAQEKIIKAGGSGESATSHKKQAASTKA